MLAYFCFICIFPYSEIMECWRVLKLSALLWGTACMRRCWQLAWRRRSEPTASQPSGQEGRRGDPQMKARASLCFQLEKHPWASHFAPPDLFWKASWGYWEAQTSQACKSVWE